MEESKHDKDLGRPVMGPSEKEPVWVVIGYFLNIFKRIAKREILKNEYKSA